MTLTQSATYAISEPDTDPKELRDAIATYKLVPEEYRSTSKRWAAARDKVLFSLTAYIVKRANAYSRGDDNLCSDLIQEGCIAAQKAIDNYDWSKGTRFITYASTRVNRYMLNFLTKESKLNQKTEVYFDQPSPETSDVVDSERQQHIQDCIQQKLGSVERTIVYEYYWNGKTMAVIAAELGKSQQRIDQLLKRALKKLETVIDEGYQYA
jgi:RNA polymerase sigma factor (sigma-70 family)